MIAFTPFEDQSRNFSLHFYVKMATQQTFTFLDEPEVSPRPKSVCKNVGKSQSEVNSNLVANFVSTPWSPADSLSSDDSPRIDDLQTSDGTVATVRNDSRDSILKQLRQQVGCVSTEPNDVRPRLSTGCEEIDQLLPCGGLRVDSLTEWVAETDSSGAAAISLITAANHLQHHPNRPLIVVDAQNQFYPPAAVALGISAHRIILVRPQRRADAIWAIDQSLRCEDVGAVWANVGAWLNDRDARRFQLAAELGNTPALLLRPKAVRGRPSFAEVRFHVQLQKQAVAHSSTLRSSASRSSLAPLAESEVSQPSMVVTIDRCRGDSMGKQVHVRVDNQARLVAIHSTAQDNQLEYQTAAMHLAQRLANPASASANSPKRRHA